MPGVAFVIALAVTLCLLRIRRHLSFEVFPCIVKSLRLQESSDCWPDFSQIDRIVWS